MSTEERQLHIVVFTGAFIKPQVEETIKLAPEDALWGRDVDIRFLECRNSFWGGNIQMCDLMTVDDSVEQLRELADWKPGLVVIPSSSFTNGRDYTGKPYTHIARRTGLQVRLLPTARIMV